MSASERLRALVAEATHRPIRERGLAYYEANDWLDNHQIALARLCADMGEALRSHVYTLSEKEMREKYPDSLATVTFDLLARLDALLPEEEV